MTARAPAATALERQVALVGQRLEVLLERDVGDPQAARELGQVGQSAGAPVVLAEAFVDLVLTRGEGAHVYRKVCGVAHVTVKRYPPVSS